jgi:parallel beta-helix repeat protein
MITRFISRFSFLIAFSIIMLACSEMPSYNPERNFEKAPKELTNKFLLAQDSSFIELPEGHFLFDQSLMLEDVHAVIIKGQGKDKTILSFKGQKQGAEGILVKNCSYISFEDFTIEDAAGDNIKATDTKNIAFRNLGCGWTGQVSEENGAYGLYPVICENVLIDNCEVYGASDAGIYVGQSDSVIISNNEVYHNVAGIESENSSHVKIYNNNAHDNTGGLLIFDLPGLTRYGSNIEAFNNTIKNNNLDNFAPKGNIVGFVPPGTGTLILATSNVDFHDNTIENNKTIGMGIISYVLVNAMEPEEESEHPVGSARAVNNNYEQDSLYNPYPGGIYVHNNTWSDDHNFPALGHDFGKLFLAEFGFDRPFIIWDGLRAEGYYNADNTVNERYKICIDEEVLFADLDLENDRENLIENPEELDCEE